MADFQPAFAFVMDHEDRGRTGKVTEDAGGRTRFGIAKKFHLDLPEDFFTVAAAEALKTAEQIYQRDYWEALRLGELESQNVANKIFDMAVNMGTHQAAVYAQRAANGLIAAPAARLHEDGVFGPATIAAINSLNPIAVYQLLCEWSRRHYQHVASINPAQAVNLAGWMKRADS
jgi:lysozyme family protein